MLLKLSKTRGSFKPILPYFFEGAISLADGLVSIHGSGFFGFSVPLFHFRNSSAAFFLFSSVIAGSAPCSAGLAFGLISIRSCVCPALTPLLVVYAPSVHVTETTT